MVSAFWCLHLYLEPEMIDRRHSYQVLVLLHSLELLHLVPGAPLEYVSWVRTVSLNLVGDTDGPLAPMLPSLCQDGAGSPQLS